MPWIVGVTKPNAEAIAAVNLQRQGYQYYYPRIRQAKAGKSPTVEPLFRRYLFIFITDKWYSLRSTRGMSHVLLGEGGPQVVAEAVIAGLRAREGSDGLVQLQAQSKFMPGDTVRVNDGPFSGHLALYEGMASHERCYVLLSMLGGKVAVTLAERMLAAA